MPETKEKEQEFKITSKGYLWKGVKIEHMHRPQLVDALIIMIHKYEALSKYQ